MFALGLAPGCWELFVEGSLNAHDAQDKSKPESREQKVPDTHSLTVLWHQNHTLRYDSLQSCHY